MTRTTTRAIFDSYHDTRRAIRALVDRSFSPRRIEVSAEVEGDWEHVPVRFTRRDVEGAFFGLLAGALAVSVGIAAHAAGYVAMGNPVETLYASGGWVGPAATIVSGSFLGGALGVLWGIGRHELTVEMPDLEHTDRFAVVVDGPKSVIAREILLRAGARRVAS